MSITFESLFKTYVELHAKPHCKSWRAFERMFARYLAHWADRPADSLTRLELMQLHADLGERIGHTTANRVIQLVRPVFNFGIEMGLIKCVNPAAKIRCFRLMPRERFFEASEIKRLFNAIDSLRYQTTRDFLYMCLFTAARRSNVASMRWSDISLEHRLWTIPETKNGTSQRLPLTDLALAVLARRQRLQPDSSWVFPSDRSPSGHLTKPEEAWREVVRRSGLKDARIHDLRRTLASWQALTGSNLAVIGVMLNHKCIKSTLIYARLNTDAVRSSMEIASAAMLQYR